MNGPLDRTVLWLTWRQLFVRKRIYAAVAFAALPLLFTFLWRFNSSGDEGEREHFFTFMTLQLIVGTLLPLAAAVFGTTAFGGEVDDGTLVYLLIKPVARWRIVLSKYVVAVVSTLAVAVPAILLPFVLLQGEEITSPMLIGFLVGATLASAIYCAIFLTLGVSSRRALVLALLYIIAFESVLTRQLDGTKSLSVREWATSLAYEASRGALTTKAYLVPMNTVYVLAPLALAIALFLCLRRVARYEMAERL